MLLYIFLAFILLSFLLVVVWGILTCLICKYQNTNKRFQKLRNDDLLTRREEMILPLPIGGSLPPPKNIKTTKEVDVLVIGGGINGTAIARQLSISKLVVMMVEKGDFSCGTSQGSAKLGHAGVRYLSNAIKGDWSQFSMVSDGMQGRRILPVLVPHIATKLGFILLNQQGENFKHRFGLTLYDFIGWLNLPLFTKGLPWNRTISNKEIRKRFPKMSKKIKCNAVNYFEYSLDDSRFVMSNVLDSVQYGCHAMNYCQCEKIEKNDTGFAVTIKDTTHLDLPKETYQCKYIVNASGAYIYDVCNLLTGEKKEEVEEVIKYKGCFIIIDKPIGKECCAYQIERKGKKKIIYMIPVGSQQEKTMIGTTDSFVAAIPLQIDGVWEEKASEEVVSRIIQTHNEKSFIVLFSGEEEVTIYSYLVREGEMNSVILLSSPSNDGKKEFSSDYLKSISRDFRILHSFGHVEILENMKKEEEIEVLRFERHPNEGMYSYFISSSIKEDQVLHLKTDVLLENDCNEATPSFNDIQYLVDASNEFFREEEHITTDNVINAFCGIRSYKKKRNKSDATKISRKHEIDMIGDNFLNVYGGKLTTSYLLACEIRKILLEKLKVEEKMSETEFLKPLVGGYIDNPLDFSKKSFEFARKKHSWLTIELYTHLVTFYGSECYKVFGIVKEDPDRYSTKLFPECNHILGEIVYHVRYGFVNTPHDFLRRRTNIELEFGKRQEIFDIVQSAIEDEFRGYLNSPKLCGFCRRSRTKLVVCEKCKIVSYCHSSNCRENDYLRHSRVCRMYQLKNLKK